MIQSAPTDQNFLQGSKFSLSFQRLPYIQWFIQSINIPGISAGTATQQTPFIDAPIPGDKMVYERLTVEFALDEPLWSWTSVNDWIKGLTFPESFEQYRNLSMQQRIQMQTSQPQYSDAILTIMTNKNNPILQLLFTQMFPVSLSGIQMSTKEPATTILTATVELAYTGYQINRMT
jgi:hypothetical protein